MPTTVTPTRHSHSTTDVANAAGCTYRQLDYWTRQGILHPSVTLAQGSGSRREWSDTDVTYARICTTLAKLGAETPTLVSTIRAVRNHPELLDQPWLVITATGDCVPTLQAHTAAWVIPLH